MRWQEAYTMQSEQDWKLASRRSDSETLKRDLNTNQMRSASLNITNYKSRSALIKCEEMSWICFYAFMLCSPQCRLGCKVQSASRGVAAGPHNIWLCTNNICQSASWCSHWHFSRITVTGQRSRLRQDSHHRTCTKVSAMWHHPHSDKVLQPLKALNHYLPYYNNIIL